MKGYFNIYFLIPLIFLYNVIGINESIRGRTFYNRQDESSDISRVKSPELNNNHKTNIYDSDYEDVNNKLINSFVENRSVKKKRSLGFINNKTRSYDIIPPSYSYRNDEFNSLSKIEDNSGNTNSNNFANTSEISIGKDNKQYTFIQKRTHLFSCGIKRKSIKWVCRENSEKITVCVPDRKIQLCIANFLNSRLETIEKFKEIFLISVNTEAKLLYNKNEGKDPSIFCNELRNSFSDFRSLFIGDDMDFGGNTDRVKGYINMKFSDYYTEKNVEKLNNIKKEWWEKNKENLWNHMIVNHKENISNECATIPEEEPQINAWIKEWNENFWMEKKRLFLNIKDKCVENKKYEACFSGCRLPCSSYTSFMKKSKTEMEVLTNLYKNKNSGEDKNKFLNDLFKKNDKTNLDDFFKNEKEYDDLCDCRYTVSIIKSFLNGPAKNDVDTASKINVNDLRVFGCNYKSNNKKSWNCTGTFTNEFPGTCVPPRRQTLCLGRTYLLHDGHEEHYKEHLLGASIYEAQLLKYKYKEKDENALCSIIQNSYADFADIIKGSDIMKDYYGKNMEESLNKVNKDKKSNEESLKIFREKWWDENKENVWKVMSAVLKNKETCKDYDKFQKTPQFLRWFKEWGDDFCEERKEKMYSFESFKVECKKKDCDENACQNKCNEYKKWIDLKKSEYDKQVEKYTKDKNNNIYDNIDEVKNKEANVYLKEKSKECNDVNFDDKIFNESPNEYEDMCKKCDEIKYLNEIKYPKTKHDIYDIGTFSNTFGGRTPISINANINEQQNGKDTSKTGNTETESDAGINVEKLSGDEKSSERREISDIKELSVTSNVNEASDALTLETEDTGENTLANLRKEDKSLLSTKNQTDLNGRGKLEEQTVHEQTNGSDTGVNVMTESNGSGITGRKKENEIDGDHNEVHAASNTQSSVSNTSDIRKEHSESSLNRTTHTQDIKIGSSGNEQSDNQKNNSHSSDDSDSLTIKHDPSEDNTQNIYDLQDSHKDTTNTLVSSQSDDEVNGIGDLDSSGDSESGGGDTISKTHDVRPMNIVREKHVNNHDFIRSGMTNNNAHNQYITPNGNNGIIRGQEESDGGKVNSEHNRARSNFSFKNDHKKNIQEYNSRDTKRVREEIIKLSKQNKCDNEYSMEYCTYSDERNSSPGPCSREERKKLCCQISDYCLKYFNFYSIEYYSCIKSEIKSPEYKCFKSEGQSNIPYFAAGGILVVIVLLLSSASRLGKSNEEYDIGEVNIEAAFEENNYLNKLSQIFNQEVQETNISDYSEYNYNEKNMY
ncbi:erythrocyte binding antigen-140 [Plasmodium reichenowi]|uniref:Erythrocyte binding antigen-140 n=1 Tax=Plasmodium reichenowi TaxID=5854 RepID=A0A2P9DKX6_PLARE|nr:erythrocyte binding antigen-140 [Plasmodium reichenowi]